MAKMKGIIIGDASGKIGNTIAKVVAGEQIISKYQPNVANPNTSGQVNTRSKFKLMSQLAAAMSPVIAIRRDGLRSSRNQFVSENFPTTYYKNESAEIALNLVQLTKSNVAMPAISVDRSGSVVECVIHEPVPNRFDKVVYVEFSIDDENNLELVGSAESENGETGLYGANLEKTDGAVVIYAYGVNYADGAAKVKYGNLEANPAQQIASLMQTSSQAAAATTLTETTGVVLESTDISAISGEGSGNGNFALPVTGTAIEGKTLVLSQAASRAKLKAAMKVTINNEVLNARYAEDGGIEYLYFTTTNGHILKVDITGGKNLTFHKGANLGSGDSISVITITGYALVFSV